MPFKSEKQRRWMHANEPKMAKSWEKKKKKEALSSSEFKAAHNKFKKTGELPVHLILNHLTVLFNVFDEAAVPLLFYNLEEDLWSYLKSFLIFLNRLSEYPQTEINLIKEDQNCLSLLHEV